MSYPLTLNELAEQIHNIAREHGFWDHEKIESGITRLPTLNPSIFEEKIALIHSEASEILEARRDGDDAAECEECIDVIIRVLDYMYARGFRPDSALWAKLQKNRERPRMHGRKR